MVEYILVGSICIPLSLQSLTKLFTLGSAVWVVNGFFVFLPELTTSVELNSTAGGWTAFVGGTLFEIGAYLMILEALNPKTEVALSISAPCFLTSIVV
jgi:hypothetical protein